MRPANPLVALTVGLALAACGPSNATSPNAIAPARCIVAFEYGRKIALNASPQRYALATGMNARIIFNVRKLKAAGITDGGQAESLAFANAHEQDAALLMQLLQGCGAQDDKDSAWQQSLPENFKIAMSEDPLCTSDPARCAPPGNR